MLDKAAFSKALFPRWYSPNVKLETSSLPEKSERSVAHAFNKQAKAVIKVITWPVYESTPSENRPHVAAVS